MAADVRRAAVLAVVLLLGFMASYAIPGGSALPQLITSALPSTTLPVSTTLPKVTTTLPKVTTTLPKVTTTLPKVTTTLPKVTTTLPKVTTTLPKVTTTLPKVTTTLPKATTTLSKVTTTLPQVSTTAGSVTRPSQATGVLSKGTSNTTRAAPSSASSTSGGILVQARQSASSSAQPGASALLFTAQGGITAGSSAVTHLQTPRPFLSFNGPKGQRAVIVVFRLRHAARVRFLVLEVFPACRIVGSFTVRGHAGLNRFRFNGRVHGKRLQPGTYQIGLRMRRGRLLRVTIAILNTTRTSPSTVATARKRNVCGSTPAFSALPAFTLQPPLEQQAQTAGAVAASSRSTPRHSLGVAPQDVVRRIGKNPFVIAALSLAVLLLGIAAMPKGTIARAGTAHVLARERSLFVLAGGAALAVGAILLAFS
jgi:hypothetical protein